MAKKLTTEDLDAKLMDLDGWSLADNAITKTFGFDGFGGSINFVNQVAKAAEAKNHHPDIDIGYDKVSLTLSTHSSGGVTEQDLELAKVIDALVAE